MSNAIGIADAFLSVPTMAALDATTPFAPSSRFSEAKVQRIAAERVGGAP